MDKDPNSETAANDYQDPELAGHEHTGIENSLQHRKHNSKKLVRKRGKVLQNGRARYSLRSSLDVVRVLRSMSKCKVKISSEPNNSAVSSVTKKRKKKRKGKSAPSNAFSQRRKHISYLLRKIDFEQSLINAYVNGWKGLNLEKIRPEKELERAKSEILQCKLRVRDAFRQLDSLLSVGRLEENLFDDNGEIDSEDIFCAKCGSKDISVDDDIILCDGICDRAFHQKCLSQPLATNEIPPEDQGWLCSACDCKVNCLDLLNEFQGTDFSIEDTWEKIFPEAASVANVNNQFDDSIYPSEDSEDYDYQPDHVEGNAEDQEEQSSSDESDSTSLSEDLGEPVQNKIDNLDLPSDDSEDDDYNPDQPEPEKDEESDLNESDFMSDSDDLCANLCETVNANAVSSNLCDSEPLDGIGQLRVAMHSPLNAANPLAEADASQGINYPTSKKRRRESSDFKKLPDEVDADESSKPSQDESEKSTVKKIKKNVSRKEPSKLPDENAQSSSNRRGSRLKHIVKKGNTQDISKLDQPQASKAIYESTSGRSQEEVSMNGDNQNRTTSSSRRLLGQNAYQISKFENRQHSRRASNISNVYGTTGKTFGKETIHSGTSTPDQVNSVTSVRNKKSSKGKIENTRGQRKILTESNRKNTGSNTPATLDQPNSLIRSSIKKAKSSKANADTPATLGQPNNLIRSSRTSAKSSKANANTLATLDQPNSLIRSSRQNTRSRKANANSPATIDQLNSLIRSSRKNAK